MPSEALETDDDDDIEYLWLLGFVELPETEHCLLRHKFPSKVGGRPAWLNPVELPLQEDLASKSSKQPLSFLVQVYCPVDGNPFSFHRSIFLFVPQDGREIKRPGSVRAFRCQLPRENAFYAFQPSQERFPQEVKDTGNPDPWHVRESEICLSRGSALQKPDGRCLLPEHALVIDEEAAPSLPSKSRGAGAGAEGQVENGIQSSDVSPDVEAAIASTTTADQKHFANFAARVSWDPEQVLRYCFQEGAEPLWPSPSPVPQESDIPSCQYCGGKRKFEFQVLPQLLVSLGIDDELDNALDWGTLAVYSCAASCDAKQAYAEEFVWVQP